jgi:mediator of RNA polymerase II transcription subunit 12
VRVTYNDTKRSQFIADLANPAIPLTRLMRNPVPHGFKGVELLETMFLPPQPGMRPGAASAAGKPPPEPIPIDRALWFIRVLGANEISAHRGRAQPASSVQAPSPAAATPSSTATSAPAPLPLNSNDWYTAEFTTAFTAWLRMQLAQLVLPTKPKPGAGTLPPPKTPTGVLGDEKSRARWLAKWQYTNSLLKQLYRKRLVSPRQLVGWLADFLGQTNLAQVGFVTQLIHENLTDVAESSSISRHCVRSACVKLKEIRASPAKDTMTKVDEQLTAIVRVLYESDPEVMLSPTTWVRFSSLVGTIVDSTTPLWADLERRNTALMFKPIVVDPGASPRRQQMAEIQMLDSICAETDMSALCKAYFNGACAPTSPKIDVPKLEEKVFILVNWAMGLYQMGVHRPYAVYTMLKKWQQWHEEIRPNDHFDFFPILYKWLDTSVPARKAENVLPIGISFGELTRQGLFSYGRYLNTLISHGHSARFSNGKGPPSHHLELLRVMPIFVEAPDLLEQRRLVISGDGENREREQAEEDHQLETFRQEMKEYVPEVFGLRRFGKSAFIRESIDYQIPIAAGVTRFEFVHSRFWLFAAAVHHFKRQGSQPPMDGSTYARVMNIFMQCRGYSTLADVSCLGLMQLTPVPRQRHHGD